MVRFAVILVALVLSPAAAAGLERPPVVAQITQAVAGRQVDAVCVTVQSEYDALAGRASAGMYRSSEDRIYLSPTVCGGLESRQARLGLALLVVAHEAAHARGIVDEGQAECWGLLWTQDLARRLFGIEFFTPASELVLSGALGYHRTTPPEYRTACS